MRAKITTLRFSSWIFLGLFMTIGAPQSMAGTLVESTSSPFGQFGDVTYVRHTGRFVGVTSNGEFRVPFEIVAPAEPERGNGKLVFEAPHFIFGTAGRDNVLGPELLFARGYSHASVGYSNEGFSLLNPFVGDAIISGEPTFANSPNFLRDVQILQQFAEALSSDPHAQEILGTISRRYAYGVSQSAEALYQLFYGPGAAGVFDLTVLHVPLWRPSFARPEVLNALPTTFGPLPDIGKVMLVSAEGDLLISQSRQLRDAVSGPDANDNYRLYEVAGAPHLPQNFVVQGVQLNFLDVAHVVRAAFVAGDLWVTRDTQPPASRIIESSAAGEIDPIYLFPTGIARDFNGNARGGVRYPDVDNGRALHIASALDIEVIPGLAGLIGFWFDLACAPSPESTTVEPRFARHGDYLRAVKKQATRLRTDKYMLPADAATFVETAAKSSVGKPGSCASN